jgi:hypothetical protein
MVKYYYSDPLKAFYMAREYGFKYKVGNNEECTINDFYMTHWNYKPRDELDKRFYILLNCHEILASKEGDKVFFMPEIES